MGQLAQWVDWSSVESGVGAVRERAPASHEDRFEESFEQSYEAFADDFGDFEAPTHPATRTASGRSHNVTPWVSPPGVTDPDDVANSDGFLGNEDDEEPVPPTMRSPLGLVTLPPAPDSGDLIVAAPVRHSRVRPVVSSLVTEATPSASSAPSASFPVPAASPEYLQSFVDAW